MMPEPSSETIAWFCLRSQPKREHIAARQLQHRQGIEVFAPRIRLRRPTREGPMWVTEALFPNYFFARFNWKTSLRLVHHAPDVRGIVHFGTYWPTVPDESIAELRRTLGPDELCVVPTSVAPGDVVKVVGGSFHDFQAVVTRVMPGRERVALLLDFLGRQTTVEVNLGMVLKEEDQRSVIL